MPELHSTHSGRRSSWRAYLAILSVRCRMLLQYRAAALAGVVTQVFWGFIKVMVFVAFFASATSEPPMTLEQVLVYIWLGQALLVLLPWNVDPEIAAQIRGGGVAAEFFVDQTRPLNELRFDWTATHELSHMLLPYVSSRDRWLSEGLASYYQNVLRARDGRLTEQQAWQKLHAGFERGRKATHGGSLAEASRAGWSATMRVYWGGAAMMLKADSQLRALSGGQQLSQPGR